MYGTGSNYVLKFFHSQTIINASAGSGGNNEGIGVGSLILKFAKLVPMVADEYMGLAVFLVVSHRYRSMGLAVFLVVSHRYHSRGLAELLVVSHRYCSM